MSLMPLPMAHVSGLLNGLLVPAAAGMTTVLMDRWDPAAGLALIERERVSFMVGPPPLFTALMDQPDFTPERVSSLRVISTGAMGVSTEFVTRATERLGAQVKRSFGSTELPTIATTSADDPFERSRDTDGRVVGAGRAAHRRSRRPGPMCRPATPGEVVVPRARDAPRLPGPDAPTPTPSPTAGSAPVTSASSTTSGWLRIVGRLKDTIIRAGENISPAEVERILEEHPGIRQAVVVGYPDAVVGERVAAFVVGDEAIDLDGARQWFRRPRAWRGSRSPNWSSRWTRFRRCPRASPTWDAAGERRGDGRGGVLNPRDRDGEQRWTWH